MSILYHSNVKEQSDFAGSVMENNKNKQLGSELKAALYHNNKLNMIITFFFLTFMSIIKVGLAWIMQLLLDSAYTKNTTKLFDAIFLAAGYLGSLFFVQTVLRWSRNRSIVIAMMNYKSKVSNKLINCNIM